LQPLSAGVTKAQFRPRPEQVKHRIWEHRFDFREDLDREERPPRVACDIQPIRSGSPFDDKFLATWTYIQARCDDFRPDTVASCHDLLHIGAEHNDAREFFDRLLFEAMQMVSQQWILAEPEFRGFVARPDDQRTVNLEQARRPRRQVAWPVVKVDDVVIVHRSQVPFEIAPEDSDALEPAEVAHRDPGTRLSTLRRGDEDLQTLPDNLSHPVASFNRAAQQCD